MINMFACCDAQRCHLLVGKPNNGIDFIEVVDQGVGAPPPPIPLVDPQRWLRVAFVNAPAPAGLTPAHVKIVGGERVTDVGVDAALYDGNVLVLHIDRLGDFSPYELRLVEPGTSDTPATGLDPLLYKIAFSFKANCPSELDCRPVDRCPRPVPEAPHIDYLAKDYGGFRRVLLDRMALLVPGWTERHAADAGIALLEVLAYVGDALSYQQDAVMTEAYLGTARQRVSVRRHARLVDYPMHDGCNARAFVAIDAASDGTVVPARSVFLTRTLFPAGVIDDARAGDALRAGALAFESMHPLTLYQKHGTMHFYTWGDARCCLPAGSTSATLAGTFDQLAVGDLLIFEEVNSPTTGDPADADPTHRAAVRLTSVTAVDSANHPITDPATGQAITEIAWGSEDALPLPFCISAVTDAGHGSRSLVDVSVARGNVVLVDHGLTGDPEALPPVPEPALQLAPDALGTACTRLAPTPVPPRYRPRLARGPLTQAAVVKLPATSPDGTRSAPFDPRGSAASALTWTMDQVVPAISLAGPLHTTWLPFRDLLDQDEFALAFVAEMGDDGIATLRFGDDEHGARPQAGDAFTATYRVGNGAAGNVGAEAIANLVGPPAWTSVVRGVRNPLAASGGVDPESLEQVRQFAPVAFRTQQRAVTPADWAEVTERRAGVARAAATFRWTGSWYTVFDAIELEAGASVDDERGELLDYLEPFRVVGRDLEVDGPEYVSLELELVVCVQQAYFRTDVEQALRQVFGRGTRPDGSPAFFNPASFSFGQPVYLSDIYAAAQAVEGVDSLEVTHLRRFGSDDDRALDDGRLAIGHLEIARLDNDPDFPEHGVLTLDLRGGA